MRDNDHNRRQRSCDDGGLLGAGAVLCAMSGNNTLTVIESLIDMHARLHHAAHLARSTLQLHENINNADAAHLPIELKSLATGATGDEYVHSAIVNCLRNADATSNVRRAAGRLRLPDTVVHDRILHYVRHVVPEACIAYTRALKNIDKRSDDRPRGATAYVYDIDSPAKRASPEPDDVIPLCAVKERRWKLLKTRHVC